MIKLIYLKSALKCDSFDVNIGIKIPFFRVSVTIEPGRSLLQFVTTNCLIPDKYIIVINAMYENNTAAIKVGNWVNRWFSVFKFKGVDNFSAVRYTLKPRVGLLAHNLLRH